MRNRFHPLALSLATLFLAFAATPASASSTAPPQQQPSVRGRHGAGHEQNVWDHNQLPPGRQQGFSPAGRSRWGRSFGAPEIDPGLAAGGLALLIGGTLVLLGQRRATRVRA